MNTALTSLSSTGSSSLHSRLGRIPSANHADHVLLEALIMVDGGIVASFEFAVEVRFAVVVAGPLVVLASDGNVAVGGNIGVKDLEAGGGKAVLEDGRDFFSGGETGGAVREGGGDMVKGYVLWLGPGWMVGYDWKLWEDEVKLCSWFEMVRAVEKKWGT